MRRTIHSRLDGTEISYDIDPSKRYAILISGGIDSGVLLYLLLKEYQLNGWTPRLQPFNMRKTNERSDAAKTMLRYLEGQFSVKLPDIIEVGDPVIHHRLQGEFCKMEIIKRWPELDYCYWGSNATPPWNYENWALDQTGSVNGRPNRSHGEGGKTRLPFLHLFKYHIIDLAVEHGQEEILRLARSCTEVLEGPRCGRCFHCQERAWGFETAGHIDPGIG